MKSTLLIVLVALVSLCGCVEERLAGPEDSTEAPLPEPPFLHGRQPSERFSGQWRSEGGALVCDGYLTRNSGEDHCESQVPEDWQGFEFDGETYYTQPLSDNGGREAS